MLLLSFFFFCQCIILFLSATALAIALRHQMIKDELSHSNMIDIETMVKTLRPGDLVYMCSRKLAWYDAYVAFLNVTGKTPYFHVFLVLTSQKMVHFVHSQYHPRLQSYCPIHPESHLRTANLHDFLVSRQSLFPVYKIYRRTPPPDYVTALSSSCPHTCELRFAGLWNSFSTSPYRLHCNSFIGRMFQKMTVFPTTLQHFTPHRMQTQYLPDAHFQCIGVFETR